MEGPRFSAGPLWRARIRAARPALAPLMAAFDESVLAAAVFDEEDDPEGDFVLFETLHEGEPERADWLARAAEEAGDAIDPTSLVIEAVPQKDWLRAVEESFPARAIGPFWLAGRHVEGPPPRGALPIILDAGLAFGSGEHGTTQGCLLAMASLKRRRPKRILDMGCGSGVLAIAAAKLWPSAEVVGVDNDAVAVDVARENAAANQVAVAFSCGDGFDAAKARAGRRYDLILANILADPLIAMAPGLARRLAPGGIAVLSGLLDRQAPAVRAAYAASGLRLRQRIDVQSWSTLALIRR